MTPNDEREAMTEREKVLMQREAYEMGSAQGFAMGRNLSATWDGPEVRETAARLYPLPKVTRPRAVADSLGVRWRVVFANTTAAKPMIERLMQGVWLRIGDPGLGVQATHITHLIASGFFADLLDNPTEEVDAEEGE